MSFIKNALRAPLALHAQYQRRLSRDAVYLAIGAIFKNEARYMREWIKFHMAIGVEHFYLYDNNSSDHFRDVLAEFEGCVTLIDWPTLHERQRKAYEHCAAHFGSKCRWLALIDLDEFLFSPTTVDARSVLRQYEGHPGILVKSPFFGTGGIKNIPDSIVETFTMRSATRFTGKSIVDPRQLRAIRNAHIATYYGAAPYAEPPMTLLRLNHYWGRSLEGLKEKVLRGDAWTGQDHRMDDHLVLDATFNETVDTVILGTLAQIKSGPQQAASRPHRE